MSALLKNQNEFSFRGNGHPVLPQIGLPQDVSEEVNRNGDQFSEELTRGNVIELRRGPQRKWFFSWELAERICELIVLGNSLESISKIVGFPSLWVIRQWRLKHPEFNNMIRIAREDRAEFYLSKMVVLASECRSRNLEPLVRLKFSFYKWASQLRDPGTFGKTKV